LGGLFDPEVKNTGGFLGQRVEKDKMQPEAVEGGRWSGLPVGSRLVEQKATRERESLNQRVETER